jgi:hypothetical protein
MMHPIFSNEKNLDTSLEKKKLLPRQETSYPENLERKKRNELLISATQKPYASIIETASCSFFLPPRKID